MKTRKKNRQQSVCCHLRKLIVSCVVLLMGLMAVAGLDDGLVVHYSMDALDASSGKVPDLSGNGRDLTLFGDAALQDGGLKGGKALYFNGVDGTYGTLKCPALKERTISLWYRRDKNDTSAHWPGVSVHRYMFNNFSTMRVLYDRENSVYFSGSWGSYTNLNQWGNAAFGFDGRVALDKWYLLTWTYSESEGEDGRLYGTMREYINGCESSVCTALVGGNMRGNKDEYDMLLGANSTTAGTIHGLVDELRIYDRALSALEVYELLDPNFGKTGDLYLRWNGGEATSEGGDRILLDSVRGCPLKLGSGVSFRDGPAGVKALWYDGSTNGWANALFPTDVVDAGVDFGAYTFCCWLYRPSDYASTQAYSEKGNYYPRILSCGGGQIKIQLNYSSYSSAYVAGGGIAEESIGPVQRVLDEWGHLAVSVHRFIDETDGKVKTSSTFYLNGVKVQESAISEFTGQLSGNCSVFLGSESAPNSTRCWYGGIGDVRFYRGALTDAEVKAVYCGLSEVSAGSDRTVGTGTVRLCGTVTECAQQVFWKGKYATAWTQVSGPATADIVNPMNLETAVNLPEKGTYVFRFASGANGVEATDDMTVVYGDPAGKTAPAVTVAAEVPSVTLPAPVKLTATASGTGALVYRWLKTSGPGGVWFEPADADVTKATFSAAGTYELACAVSDGENETVGSVEVTVAAGVALPTPSVYIPFDFIGEANLTSSVQTVRTIYDAARNVFQSTLGTEMTLVPVGILGDCLHTADSFAEGDKYYTEFGNVPRSNKRTISAWIKYTNPLIDKLQHCHPFDLSGDLGFQVESLSSFQLQMNLCDNAGKYLIYYLSDTKNRLGYSLVDRWFHLCITIDATESFTMETEEDFPTDFIKFYIDGVQMKTTYNAQYSTALYDGGDKTKGHFPYTYVPKTSTQASLTFGYGANRYLPGDIDEFRIYNDVILTPEQIRRLARDPNPELRNRRPIAEVISPADSAKVLRKKALALNGAAFDDGHPTDGTLTAKWVVTSDETGAATVADDSLANGRFVGRKVGTCRLAVEASDGFFTTRSEPIDVEVEKSGLTILVR